MTIADILVDVDVRVAWWLWPYMTAAALLDRIGVSLDFRRVARTVDRGITISIAGGARRRLWTGR